MIVGTEEHGLPGYLQEYKTTTGDVFQAGFGQAVDDNLVTGRLPDTIRSQNADNLEPTREEVLAGFMPNAGPMVPRRNPNLSRADALTKAKEAGVEIKNIPDNGIGPKALDILIERQYQKKRRQEAISSAGGGFANAMAEFGGGLGGSMIDPLNIAASFIPVGQARWAGMLAKAASPLERAGIRAASGAVEGAVGAAVIEPFNYAAAQEVGDDYTMAESLMNVTFGTFMGAGMHMGFGAMGDAVKMGKSPAEAGPVGPLAKQLDAASPETRMAYAKAAIAQAMEDRPIDVTAVRQLQLADVKMKLAQVDSKIQAAARSQDIEMLDMLEQQRQILLDQTDNAPSKSLTEIKVDEDYTSFKTKEGATASVRDLDRDGIEMFAESDKYDFDRAILIEDIKTPKDIQGKGVGSALLAEIESRAENNGAEAIFLNASPTGSLHKAQDLPKLIRFYEKNGFEVIQLDKENALMMKTILRDNTGGSPNVAFMDVPSLSEPTGGAQASPTSPDARFLSPEIIEQHAQELKDVPRNMRVEEASAMADDAVLELNEMAKQTDLDVTTTIKEMNDIVKSSKEFGTMVKTMARCATRKT